MVSSLSNLVNNLSEGIHRIKCKFEQDDKNVKQVEINVSTRNTMSIPLLLQMMG